MVKRGRVSGRCCAREIKRAMEQLLPMSQGKGRSCHVERDKTS